MKFRPCIDLHSGAVKQIVGSSLKDGEQPRTNFISELPSTYYADLYRKGNDVGRNYTMLTRAQTVCSGDT